MLNIIKKFRNLITALRQRGILPPKKRYTLTFSPQPKPKKKDKSATLAKINNKRLKALYNLLMQISRTGTIDVNDELQVYLFKEYLLRKDIRMESKFGKVMNILPKVNLERTTHTSNEAKEYLRHIHVIDGAYSCYDGKLLHALRTYRK